MSSSSSGEYFIILHFFPWMEICIPHTGSNQAALRTHSSGRVVLRAGFLRRKARRVHSNNNSARNKTDRLITPLTLFCPQNQPTTRKIENNRCQADAKNRRHAVSGLSTSGLHDFHMLVRLPFRFVLFFIVRPVISSDSAILAIVLFTVNTIILLE